MDIEKREAEKEALGSDITTKEKNLAGRIEKGAGLVAMGLFITGSVLAKEAVEKIPTEPEKIKFKQHEIVEANKTKPLLLEQMKLTKKLFATAKLEKGEIKIEPPKAEVEEPEAPKEAKPEIELTEEGKIEKKPFSG